MHIKIFRVINKNMHFKIWLESQRIGIYYHGTSDESAKSILAHGIDVSKYRSGMYLGFYLTPNLNYFKHRELERILEFKIDESKILDRDTITEDDLAKVDPHYRAMSFGWRNTLVKRICLEHGYSGIRDGKEVILFNNDAILGIRII
jgi:hypothetical protein